MKFDLDDDKLEQRTPVSLNQGHQSQVVFIYEKV